MKPIARCLLSALLVALLAAPLHAALRPNEGLVVGPGLGAIVDRFPQAAPDSPACLATDRDVYLIIRAGAGYASYRAVALNSVDARRLALALEAGWRGTRLAGRDVEFEGGGTYAIAASVNDRVSPRPGAWSASSSVPVGSVVRAFRQAGFRPHTLLMTPRYASTPGLGPAQRVTRADVWRCGSGLPVEAAVIGATLPPSDIVLALLYLLGAPLCAAGGVMAAVSVARRKAIPLPARRRVCWRLALYPAAAGLAAHILFAAWYIGSEPLRALVDVWFGDNRSEALCLASVFGEGLLLMVVGAMLAAARGRLQRLLGPTEADGMVPLPEETAEDKALRRRALPRSLAAAVAVLAIAWAISQLPLGRQSALPAIALAAGMSWALIAVIASARQRLFRPRREDAVLTERARDLAGDRADAPLTVEVVESPYGRRAVAVGPAPAGGILVSRRAIEVMEPAEMDFLLAHAAGAAQPVAFRPEMAALAIYAGLTLASVMAAVEVRDASVYAFVGPIAMLLWTGAMAFGGWWTAGSVVRMEAERDLPALEATRNLAAAESALRKVARYRWVEGIDGEPGARTRKRLAALRARARELGLPGA